MSGTSSITLPDTNITAQRPTTSGKSLNNPNAPGIVTRPRLRVLSGKTEIPGCVASMVESNNHFQADRFSLRFIPTRGDVGSLKWWSQQKEVPVDIQLGMQPTGATSNATQSWTSMLTGSVDRVELNLDGNHVTVEGRDLTANFIDNKATGTYVNQSSSEIITALATSRGLIAKAAPTDGTSGRFWDSDRQLSSFNQSSRVTTEWDLIVSLAKKEGYDAYVQGSTLFFQPIATAGSNVYIWDRRIDASGRNTGNVEGLEMHRTLRLSRGMHVKVNSWHQKQARGFSKTSRRSNSIGPDDTSFNQNEYVVQRPNMTEDEAQTYADKLAAELALHELTISAHLFGDMLLTPRVVVRLQGTGTDFDQDYYTTCITKHVSMHDGFKMNATCKNKASEPD